MIHKPFKSEIFLNVSSIIENGKKKKKESHQNCWEARLF